MGDLASPCGPGDVIRGGRNTVADRIGMHYVNPWRPDGGAHGDRKPFCPSKSGPVCGRTHVVPQDFLRLTSEAWECIMGLDGAVL
jgi:hypothetical protein